MNWRRRVCPPPSYTYTNFFRSACLGLLSVSQVLTNSTGSSTGYSQTQDQPFLGPSTSDLWRSEERGIYRGQRPSVIYSLECPPSQPQRSNPPLSFWSAFWQKAKGESLTYHSNISQSYITFERKMLKNKETCVQQPASQRRSHPHLPSSTLLTFIVHPWPETVALWSTRHLDQRWVPGAQVLNCLKPT